MTDDHPLFAFAFRGGRGRALRELEVFDVATSDVDFRASCAVPHRPAVPCPSRCDGAGGRFRSGLRTITCGWRSLMATRCGSASTARPITCREGARWRCAARPGRWFRSKAAFINRWMVRQDNRSRRQARAVAGSTESTSSLRRCRPASARTSPSIWRKTSGRQTRSALR